MSEETRKSEAMPPGPFMGRALRLAEEMVGLTSPNPTVGAVIVRDGRIIGEGRYEGRGTPHAEAAALADAGEGAPGATAYVTLEPCCHQGRTPPCAAALVEAGVAEVHFPHLDPDTKVSGGGQAMLEEAGIRVIVGEGEADARRINEAYLKHRSTGHPFVIAKFAASLDGKIAATSGDSRWVSGPGTRAWSQRLRTRIDAIAVGVSTILVDDPQLTARIEEPDGASHLAERQPLRVVLDSQGRTPMNSKVLGCGAKALIATTDASSMDWRRQMESTGARIALLPSGRDGRVDLPSLLALLGEDGVLTLLVEGGGGLHGSFFDQGLVDKVYAVIAPMVVGGESAPTAIAGLGATRMADALRLQDVTVERLGEDMLITGYPPAGA